MRQREALVGITENQGVLIVFHFETAEVADFVSLDLGSPHHNGLVLGDNLSLKLPVSMNYKFSLK